MPFLFHLILYVEEFFVPTFSAVIFWTHTLQNFFMVIVAIWLIELIPGNMV